MSNELLRIDPHPLNGLEFRIDAFSVPTGSRNRVDALMRQNVAFIETLPGFLHHMVFARLEHGMLTERYAVMDDHLPRGAGGASRVRRADVAHFMLDEAEYPAHVARVVGISYTKEV